MNIYDWEMSPDEKIARLDVAIDLTKLMSEQLKPLLKTMSESKTIESALSSIMEELVAEYDYTMGR